MKKVFFIISLCVFVFGSCKTTNINKSPEKGQLALFVDVFRSGSGYKPIVIVSLEDSILLKKKFKADKGPEFKRFDSQMHLLNIDKKMIYQKKLSFVIGERDTSIVFTNCKIDSIVIMHEFHKDGKFQFFDNFDRKRWIIY